VSTTYRKFRGICTPRYRKQTESAVIHGSTSSVKYFYGNERELIKGDTWTTYSIVENCGRSSAGWLTSDIPA